MSAIAQTFREMPEQHRAYALQLARQYGRIRVRCQLANDRHAYHVADRLSETLADIMDEGRSLVWWGDLAIASAGNEYYTLYQQRAGRQWDSWQETYV